MPSWHASRAPAAPCCAWRKICRSTPHEAHRLLRAPADPAGRHRQRDRRGLCAPRKPPPVRGAHAPQQRARRNELRERPPAAGAVLLGRAQPHRDRGARPVRHGAARPGRNRRDQGQHAMIRRTPPVFGNSEQSSRPSMSATRESARADTRVPPRAAQRVRPANTKARLYTVAMLLALASTGLVVRAVDLQVVRKDFYQGQGDARYLREMPISVSRGTVFDRNGEPLAVSTPMESIWANPQGLASLPEQLPDLAKGLGVELDVLRDKLDQRAGKEFLYLKRHLNPVDARAILDLKIPGVFSQREFRRYYPSGEVMAHVLGFTNIDDHGQEGLELAFDDWLAGKPGAKRVIRDRLGNIVENVELLRAPQAGRDLALSIDRRIQYLAYRELKTALLEHKATSGSIAILDASNGEVLAMVNLPSYNPNALGNADIAARRNRAVTDVMEPGSTMKPFTISTALESGKFKPTTPIDTSPGSLALPGGYLIRDTRTHGLTAVTAVLTLSSTEGAAKIAALLPNEHLYDMYHRFGFGQAPGSGFPGETSGVLPSLRSWGPVEKATMSYGYGLSVTPLQLAQAYAT